MDRLLDGTIAADTESAALLAKASLALEDGEQDRLDVVDQLDAFASGLGTLAKSPPAPVSDATPAPRPEPPLLTVRHDGTPVTVGSFEPEASRAVPEADAPPAKTSSASAEGKGTAPANTHSVGARGARFSPRKPLPATIEKVAEAPQDQSDGSTPTATTSQPSNVDQAELLTDFAAAAARLSAQVGALELLVGPDLERAASELSATSAEIVRIKDAIETWLTANPPPEEAVDEPQRAVRQTRRRRGGR